MRYRLLAIIVASFFIEINQVKAQEQLLRFERQVIETGTMTEDDAPRTYTFVGKNVSGRVQSLTSKQHAVVPSRVSAK